ncbi:MAG TPA: 3-hydroxyacyl-CoA dehydrogenase family protein, partial [Candidatus Dormibacteraeota bacterium]|nr:3-hydroxyacyl-CoA dehydrogenase family protein [Candidatus Dormibacteraeota bacterium]
KMGPFSLMDFIGLDINLATTRSVFERSGAARLAPVAEQAERVAQGLLGRKSGKGFYDYASGERAPRAVAPLEESGAAFDERVSVLGFGALADEIATLIEARTSDVARIENEEFLTGIDPATTIAFDAGDGTTDRGTILLELDTLLDPSCAIFVDAYSTDLRALLARATHPERFVGYGILGELQAQQVVEIVDSDAVDDEMLELAEEFFAALGRRVVLVTLAPGLVLGRIVGSVVNEAMIAVHEGVATAEDIDLAMRLGTNYPLGPIAWGREIGGARIARILRELARAEGTDFGPHRSLWMLDIEAGEESAEFDEVIE